MTKGELYLRLEAIHRYCHRMNAAFSTVMAQSSGLKAPLRRRMLRHKTNELIAHDRFINQ